MNSDLDKKLSKFLKENNIPENELCDFLELRKKLNKNKEIKESQEHNKSLVGKCYKTTLKTTPFELSFNFPYFKTDKDMEIYIKVISSSANSSVSVTCLVVTEKPLYKFESQKHKLFFVGDGVLGNFHLYGVKLSSIPIVQLNKLEEITSEQFAEKLVSHSKQLAALEFKIKE